MLPVNPHAYNREHIKLDPEEVVGRGMVEYFRKNPLEGICPVINVDLAVLEDKLYGIPIRVVFQNIPVLCIDKVMKQ